MEEYTNGFIKLSSHSYSVKNQNGLNNALYDYFKATDNGIGNTYSKEGVRKMIQSIPPHYPISFIIIDRSFECARVYLEFIDSKEKNNNMEKLLTQLIEKSKTDRKALIVIKNLAVQLGQFELAVHLKEIEQEAFPETEEIKQMRVEIKQLTRTFALMGMTLDDHTSWLVNETVKLYNQKGGELSLEDATKLITLRDQLYPKL